MPISINAITVADRQPTVGGFITIDPNGPNRFNVAYTASLPLGGLTVNVQRTGDGRTVRNAAEVFWPNFIQQGRPGVENSWTGSFGYTQRSGRFASGLQPLTTYTFTFTFSNGQSPISVTFTTTRALRLTANPQTFEGTNAPFRVTPGYTGTVYYRWGRVGSELTNTGTFEGTANSSEIVTFRDVYPNRDFRVEFSEFADFDPVLDFEWRQPNLDIPGIVDPSLTFDRTVALWRRVLGLGLSLIHI